MLDSVDFQKKLLLWYRANKRSLPWRQTESPYHIWISEIFLQQTRVESVVPYYTRFIDKFPCIEQLASADLQSVLKCCEGIGYYSRIRNLHKTAKILQKEYKGRFPDIFSDIVRLPGIGEYTAAAICSIAFDQKFPAIDGNVLRVYSRLFSIKEDILKSSVRKRIKTIVEETMPSDSCGEFNQAVMELGALLCTPANPVCAKCPVVNFCTAREENIQSGLPFKKQKKSVPSYHVGAGLVWKSGKILITRRPEEGFLGGLWELPGGKKEENETIEQCIAREIREEVRVQVKVSEFFKRIKHAYSHFHIILDVYHCQWIKGDPECISCIDWCWADISQLRSFPFPRANKKIIDELYKHF